MKARYESSAQRERTKGLKTKRRLFLHKHGEWIAPIPTALELGVHKSTALRELHNLRIAGLMEAELRGKNLFFRAIKPKDVEFTIEMFLTTREIEEVTMVYDEAKVEKPLPDHSWMPQVVRAWGGYRVAA